MKRFLMVALMLVLVFGLSSVTFAEEIVPLGCGPGGNNPPTVKLDEQAICIKADNPLYGKIEGLPTECVSIGEFESKKNSLLDKSFDFQIRSNAYLKVILDLDKPLTHIQYNDEVLATHVRMRQRVGQNNFTNRLSVYNKWPNQGTKLTDNYTMTDVVGGAQSGRGIRDYRFTVQSQLGDVHDQAAGHYKGNIVLTLVAP